jgi:hypothetical protein
MPRCAVLFILLLSLPFNGINQTFSIESKISIRKSYNQLEEFYKWYYDSTYCEKAKNTIEFECFKLVYKSDTAKVEAWLYKPVRTSKKLQIIIYNREGNRNFGNLEETNLVDFFDLLRQGM